MKLSSWNTNFCWQDQHKLIKVDITSCDWQWWWLGLQSREICRRHWRGSVQAVRRRTQDTSLSKISDNYDGVEIIEHCKSHSDSKQAYGLSQLCTQQAQGKCRSLAASSSRTPSHCSVLVLTINDFHSASAFGIPSWLTLTFVCGVHILLYISYVWREFHFFVGDHLLNDFLTLRSTPSKKLW